MLRVQRHLQPGECDTTTRPRTRHRSASVLMQRVPTEILLQRRAAEPSLQPPVATATSTAREQSVVDAEHCKEGSGQHRPPRG